MALQAPTVLRDGITFDCPRKVALDRTGIRRKDRCKAALGAFFDHRDRSLSVA